MLCAVEKTMRPALYQSSPYRKRFIRRKKYMLIIHFSYVCQSKSSTRRDIQWSVSCLTIAGPQTKERERRLSPLGVQGVATPWWFFRPGFLSTKKAWNTASPSGTVRPKGRSFRFVLQTSDNQRGPETGEDPSTSCLRRSAQDDKWGGDRMTTVLGNGGRSFLRMD